MRPIFLQLLFLCLSLISLLSLGALTTPNPAIVSLSGDVTATGPGNVTSTVSTTEVFLSEILAANTAGGDSTGSFTTRTLNTVDDHGTGVTLSSNEIVFPAGPASTWDIYARAPVFHSDQCMSRLRNITAGTTVIEGSSAFAESSSGTSQTDTIVLGRFSLGSTTTSIHLAIQTAVGTGVATNGYGRATNLSTHETYTQVHLIKVH